MSVNIMMLIVMYPMMMIVCFVMYTSQRPKSGMAFGCSISAERMKNETLKEIERQWAAQMKRNILITAFFPFLSFLIPYTSIQLTIWIMWCFVLIVLLELPFIKANVKVKEVKRSMGWYDKEHPEIYVELQSAGQIRRVKVKTFLLPFGVSMLAAAIVYGFSFFENSLVKNPDYVCGFGIVILLFASINLVILVTAHWMDEQKTEVISSRSEVNLNYARAKKNIWKNYWLTSSWITTGYVWVCALSLLFYIRFDLTVLAGSVLYSLVLIILLVPVIQKIREVEAVYEKEREWILDGDDDKYWIGGTFYCNPADKHWMVSMRNGLGTTVNLATKAGKIWWLVTVLALLSIPVLCGFMILEEFTPISLSIKENELLAVHLKTEYEIPIEEIQNLKITQKLPQMTKSVGTAMDNVAKGTFREKGTGEKCILFVNPENEKFLCFEWKGQLYYMSGLSDEETMNLYQAMQ